MSNLPQKVSPSSQKGSPGSSQGASPLSSSVFNSPDKNSIPELKIRQAINSAKFIDLLTPSGDTSPINHMAKILRPIPVYATPVTPPKEIPSPAPRQTTPPLGYQIPESLVRDILAKIKKDYPWAEAILASKMCPEQFKIVLDRYPHLRHIITSRLPTTQVNAATVALAAIKRQAEKEEKKRTQNLPIKFIEFLCQIKKLTEVGLLDEELLDEPLSPMTMSMIHSVMVQVKKLVELHRAQLAGKGRNLEEEMAIRRQLKEVREYIREEQKLYIEGLKKRPEGEKMTMEQILKKYF